MSNNEYVFVEHVEDTPNTPPRGRIRKLRNSVRRGFSKMGRHIRNSGRRLFSKKHRQTNNNLPPVPPSGDMVPLPPDPDDPEYQEKLLDYEIKEAEYQTQFQEYQRKLDEWQSRQVMPVMDAVNREVRAVNEVSNVLAKPLGDHVSDEELLAQLEGLGRRRKRRRSRKRGRKARRRSRFRGGLRKKTKKKSNSKN